MTDSTTETNPPVFDPVKRLHFGAAYYPEHWPEDSWSQDIELMKAASFSVVRVGEFAWSTFEPSEGKFDFDWMERAVDLLAESGLQTVMGTPTAAPPAWLVNKNPESLAVDESGQRIQFGNRCHYCVNAPKFHQAVQRIVSAMGARFGSNPNIIGWQLDNEYSRTCTCDICRAAFQDYLKKRYGSLKELNQRWSTAYWSQTYSRWSQIPIPIGPHNPGLMLAFKQFTTFSYQRFQQLQLDSLRPHLPENIWVTHNFMGWYDGFDHYALNEDLDMASWDAYVGSGHHDPIRQAAKHDLTRGFKRRNFWVMETQPGSVNWSGVNNALNRGEARAMAWQGIGHGADAILFWQWRSALGGQEQYHGSLIDPSGQPRPFYQEAARLGRDLDAAGTLLADTQPVPAKIAILNDYPSRWSIQWQRHHKDFDYVEYLLSYYRVFARQNIPVDIISADVSLEGYDIVIAPALLIVDEERTARFTEYVQKGGYLVVTQRCGMKDHDNALLPSRQPGPLASLTGLEVEEYFALDEPVEVIGNWFNGETRLWAEQLKSVNNVNVSVIARYGTSNGWLDNQYAIAVRSYSYGLVYYLGAHLDDEAMLEFFERMLKMKNIVPILKTPPGLEACKRVNPAGDAFYILINQEMKPLQFELPWPADEKISGQRLSGKVSLAPYGVAVLAKIPEEPTPEPTGEGEAEAGSDMAGSSPESEPKAGADGLEEEEGNENTQPPDSQPGEEAA